jgi:hypothetical protein
LWLSARSLRASRRSTGSEWCTRWAQGAPADLVLACLQQKPLPRVLARLGRRPASLIAPQLPRQEAASGWSRMLSVSALLTGIRPGASSPFATAPLRFTPPRPRQIIEDNTKATPQRPAALSLHPSVPPFPTPAGHLGGAAGAGACSGCHGDQDPGGGQLRRCGEPTRSSLRKLWRSTGS